MGYADQTSAGGNLHYSDTISNLTQQQLRLRFVLAIPVTELTSFTYTPSSGARSTGSGVSPAAEAEEGVFGRAGGEASLEVGWEDTVSGALIFVEYWSHYVDIR
jgi:hypothetical protein